MTTICKINLRFYYHDLKPVKAQIHEENVYSGHGVRELRGAFIVADI